MANPVIPPASVSSTNNNLLVLGAIVAVTAFLVSRKEVYALTHKLLKNTLDANGNPSTTGIVVHSAVVGVVLVALLTYYPNLRP